MKPNRRLFLLVVFCGVCSGAFAQKGRMATLLKLSDEFETLSEKVSPAIAQVLATGYAPVDRGQAALTKQRSTGSGVIVDPGGLLITNAHVVKGARRLQVVLALPPNDKRQSILKPRGKIVGAQLIGIDYETDLAVLRVQETGLPFLELGDSDQVRKGQVVLAFGNPLGLENTVTMGVVSALARQLKPDDPMIYIQTDAPINPGNSGGPLVDTDGRVIGINTLIFSQSGGSEGIGFAAPSNIVKNVYEQIRTSGRVRRGVIGASAQTITPLLAEGLGLNSQGRIIVADVQPFGPAHSAGLKPGDIILSLDNKPMENARQFDVNLYSRNIGEDVLVEIVRGDVTKVLKVAIKERPDDPDRFFELVSPEQNLIPRLDLLALDISETTLKMLPPLQIQSGVIVANYANLYYESESLQPGDVIHAINSESVSSIAELKVIVSELKKYDAVVAQVERRGEFRYIAFELE